MGRKAPDQPTAVWLPRQLRGAPFSLGDTTPDPSYVLFLEGGRWTSQSPDEHRTPNRCGEVSAALTVAPLPLVGTGWEESGCLGKVSWHTSRRAQKTWREQEGRRHGGQALWTRGPQGAAPAPAEDPTLKTEQTCRGLRTCSPGAG